ncbi:hypothetical protein COM86_21530 [Priestia megaterium]|uniref:hypothetical protein n=1 Tax=Priestia megaterium TaxID=1404 RepID=UPI000BEE47BC|nr:hypothetical protein [Priestia megaterium]PEB61945.1 hypothetical protein COM86_21530 [Priestia megaterium]
MITINKDKYYILKSKNGKCYLILLTSKKSKGKKHKKTCLKKSTCTKCQKKCLKKCLKKCKKKSLKDYTKVTIQVPQPQGEKNVPTHMYFYLHKSFTAKQEQRIKGAIRAVLLLWFDHLNEKWDGGTNTGISQLALCTSRYATKNFKPVWAKSSVPNAIAATNLAMNQLTRLIRENGFKKSPPATIDPRNSTTIYATTASIKGRVPLSLQINPKQLDNTDFSDLKVTGSMLHAWLHHAGWKDPKTTNYFISECPMCVMRDLKDKNPQVRDSSFYKFFD